MRASRAGPGPSGNVVITGGTIMGATLVGAAPQILAHTAIPWISLPTSTMTAGGAITVGTALPVAYAQAWCYFPANAVATVAAAGWRYCTFTTTTAGTAFLDQPGASLTGSGIAFPTSPTACTTASNFTGDTAEELLPSIAVAANLLGKNGAIYFDLVAKTTNSVNTKTLRLHYSGSGGSALALGITSTADSNLRGYYANRGATNVQYSYFDLFLDAALNRNIPGVLAVDTTVATTVVPSLQKTTATENFVLDMIVAQALTDAT